MKRRRKVPLSANTPDPAAVHPAVGIDQVAPFRDRLQAALSLPLEQRLAALEALHHGEIDLQSRLRVAAWSAALLESLGGSPAGRALRRALGVATSTLADDARALGVPRQSLHATERRIRARIKKPMTLGI